LDTEVADPIALWRELRNSYRVYPGDVLLDKLGLQFSIAQQGGNPPVFTPLHYDDCMQVLRDYETFSSTVYQPTLGTVQGVSLIMVDPPEHTRLRALLGPIFTRKRMELWQENLVEQLFNKDYLDRLMPQGRLDVFHDIAVPYPVQVIHHVLGLPPESSSTFQNIAAGLLLFGTRPDIGMACSEWLRETLTQAVETHRGKRDESLVDRLVYAEAEGEATLTNDEIVNFLRVLLPAGGDTTTKLLANLTLMLLNNPDQFALLRARPELLPNAMEEALRLEPSTAFVFRNTTKDTSLGDVDIPVGSGITVAIASANRDEKRFPRPDEFDITRDNIKHLSFSFGPHMCIGMHMARMEVSTAMTAMTAMMKRMPNMRLDPDAPTPQMMGGSFRWPSAVPVVWD
jgi:cytochrome P450